MSKASTLQLKNLEKYLHPEEGGDDGAGGAAELIQNFMPLKRPKSRNLKLKRHFSIDANLFLESMCCPNFVARYNDDVMRLLNKRDSKGNSSTHIRFLLTQLCRFLI